MICVVAEFPAVIVIRLSGCDFLHGGVKCYMYFGALISALYVLYAISEKVCLCCCC